MLRLVRWTQPRSTDDVSEHAPKYCRTTTAIAAVLGIELYAQRKRRAAQLAEILGWTKRPDFPKRHKGAGKGWLIAEVDQWGYDFAKIVAEEKRIRAARSDAFNSDKPRKETLATLGANGANCHGAELVQSQSHFAELIGQHFKIPPPNKRYIQKWLHGRDLPTGTPPFPPPDKHGKWPDGPEAGLAWYEKHILTPQRAGEGQGTLFERKVADAQMAELEETIDKARKARIEADALERADDKNYITRAAFLEFADTVGLLVNGAIDSLERTSSKRFAECATVAGLPAGTREQLLAELGQAQIAGNEQLKDALRRGLEEAILPEHVELK